MGCLILIFALVFGVAASEELIQRGPSSKGYTLGAIFLGLLLLGLIGELIERLRPTKEDDERPE